MGRWLRGEGRLRTPGSSSPLGAGALLDWDLSCVVVSSSSLACFGTTCVELVRGGVIAAPLGVLV